MKKLCTLYGNCQMDGCRHFLAKTRMGGDYEFQTFHNWRLMLNEEETAKELLHFAKESDVFIYQPCRGFECKDGTKVPATDAMNVTGKKISTAYLFNHGFFPMVKVGDGWDGWITSEQVKSKMRALHKNKDEYAGRFIIMEYLGSGLQESSAHRDLNFDCARRFIECLAEQARREEETDIKMVPFILQNYRKRRLFLTYNHPTTALFLNLAFEVMDRIYPGWKAGSDPICGDTAVWGENEANMNGVMPIHPAVVRELGLEYQPTDHSIEYYRDLLEQMMRELK